MSRAGFGIAELGDICIHVSSFLQLAQIARSEEAGIFSCKDVARLSWHKAALALLAEEPIWGPSGESVIQQLLESGVRGKPFLQEMRLLRRAIFPPKSWSPAIHETAFNSLKVLPHSQTDEGEGAVGPPMEAAVPLTVGTRLGRPLAVGIELQPDSDEGLTSADMQCGFCIGVELCSSLADGRTMSVMFAPFSGQCYMQYGGERCVMCAEVIPPLQQTITKLRAWAQVAQDGSIFFARQIPGSEVIEETGHLPRECLPAWTAEIFAGMYFWRDHISKAFSATVVHCAQMLPDELSELEGCSKEIETTWHLQS